MIRRVLASLAVAAMTFGLVVRADDSAKKPAEEGSNIRDEAAQKQMQLEKRFTDLSVKLRTLAERMARSTEKGQREKAQQLNEALELASKAQIGNKFRVLITTLNKGGNVDAADEALDQSRQILETLESMLKILETDNAKARAEEIERLEKLLKEINQVIRDQKIVRRKTELNPNDPNNDSGQKDVTGKTEDIHAKLGGDPKGGKKTPDSDKGGAKGGEKGKPGEGDAKAKGGDAAKPKDGDNKGKPADPKGGDPKAGDPKAGDPKAGDPKAGDAKGGDPKGGDPKAGDAKGGDPKAGDPKPGDPKGGDAAKGKDGDAGKSKPGDSKGGEPGKGKGKPSDGGGDGDAGGKGKPGDPPPAGPDGPPKAPPLPGRDSVEEAIKSQKKAEEKKGEDKIPLQDDAVDKLEKARAELEKLLKQKRDEEMIAKLAELKARCELMLAMQEAVYKGTLEVFASIQGQPDKKAQKQDIFRSQQLSDQEGEIVKEAKRALGLLEGEGHSVAFLEIFRQLHEDMVLVQNRLGRTDPGKFTQNREEEIIMTLKDMIAALDKAIKDKQAPPPPPGPPGTPPPPAPKSLLDKLAELKLVKSRQLIINKRTTDYAKEFPGQEAPDAPEIQDEVKKLSKDQAKLKKIMDDMATKKNE